MSEREVVNYRELSTIELLREFIISKLPLQNKKHSVERKKNQEPPQPPENANINSIAVVLDNRVEEVIRCQNRLSALLLSEPTFVEFDPALVDVKIGVTEYLDGEFKSSEDSGD